MTVLARVENVSHDRATLALFPGVTAELEHDSITDNPRDNIEDLLTLGEVVTAHLPPILESPTPGVTLRLDLVDDDAASDASPVGVRRHPGCRRPGRGRRSPTSQSPWPQEGPDT
jgi:hypothetical protein